MVNKICRTFKVLALIARCLFRFPVALLLVMDVNGGKGVMKVECGFDRGIGWGISELITEFGRLSKASNATGTYHSRN